MEVLEDRVVEKYGMSRRINSTYSGRLEVRSLTEREGEKRGEKSRKGGKEVRLRKTNSRSNGSTENCKQRSRLWSETRQHGCVCSSC